MERHSERRTDQSSSTDGETTCCIWTCQYFATTGSSAEFRDDSRLTGGKKGITWLFSPCNVQRRFGFWIITKTRFQNSGLEFPSALSLAFIICSTSPQPEGTRGDVNILKTQWMCFCAIKRNKEAKGAGEDDGPYKDWKRQMTAACCSSNAASSSMVGEGMEVFVRNESSGSSSHFMPFSVLSMKLYKVDEAKNPPTHTSLHPPRQTPRFKP